MTLEELTAIGKSVSVGWWYTFCCQEELTQILSASDLPGVDDDDPSVEFYPSLRDALVEIRAGWSESGEQLEVADCDKRLAELAG